MNEKENEAAVPSSIIKTCLPSITPLIIKIINSSLTSGSVPTTQVAAVPPILEKRGLNPDIMSIFRPITNLPFLSKMLERVVAAQIQTHLTTNNLFEPFQSGFAHNTALKQPSSK